MRHLLSWTLAMVVVGCGPEAQEAYQLIVGSQQCVPSVDFDDLEPEQQMLWPEGVGAYGPDNDDGVSSVLYAYSFQPVPGYACDGRSPELIAQLLISTYRREISRRDVFACQEPEPIVVAGGCYTPPTETTDNSCLYQAYMLSRCNSD